VPFKLYCRIVRLKQAASLIASPSQRELVDIAIDAGYSDQSHMTRDFVELAGTSPGRLRQNDVAFFQYHASR
jgi:transcriptional regulator GlxA family with amidase domain